MSIRSRDPFRPVEAGLETTLTPWLIPGYFLGVVLPWIVPAWLELTRRPGPSGLHAALQRQTLDMMAVGLTMFDASAVFAVALGCLIVTLMKSRPRYADSMEPPAE